MKHIWGLTKKNLDYGTLRIGIGKIPSPLHYKIKWNSNPGTDLVYKALDLCHESRTISDAPIIISLLPEKDHKAIHIYGEENLIYSTIQTFLLQLSLGHSPIDLNVSILTNEHTALQWRGFESLYRESNSKIVWSVEQEDSYYGEPNFFRYALQRLRLRQDILSNEPLNDTPLWIIIFDLFNTNWQSNLDRVDQKRLFYELLTTGNQLRILPIMLSSGKVRLPNLEYTQLEIFRTSTSSYFRLHTPTTLSQIRIGQLETPIEPEILRDLPNQLADLNAQIKPHGNIPRALTLLDIFNSRNISELNIAARWKRNENDRDWLSVPIGVNESGQIVSLELKANLSGIHGLIAGTTGSGKSELLTTIILGLSVNYSPQLVNFVLVDYKGGENFWEFENLPHCIDIITNLAQNQVARFFRVIRAEMDRRSTIIAGSKTNHIVDYQKRGYHHTREPLPFLVIIIDEFAEMVAGNPEYRQELDRMTRLGRAIGMHLILAAQHLTGVVTDQMRANMKFRIVLRVAASEDSRELLKATDAAYLPTQIPGRAYLKIGNEDIELVQIAYSSGDYESDDHNYEEFELLPLDQVLVKKLQASTMTEDLPQKLWVKPLPFYNEFNYRDLMREQLTKLTRSNNNKIAIGLLDFYTHYEGLYIDLSKSNSILFGEEQTGKTTFLQTFVLETIQSLNPNSFQIYLVDMGGGDLSNLRELFQIGGYISRIETDRIERLLSGLQKLVYSRKADLESAHVEDYVAYNQSHPNNMMTIVIVVIVGLSLERENQRVIC